MQGDLWMAFRNITVAALRDFYMGVEGKEADAARALGERLSEASGLPELSPAETSLICRALGALWA